MTMKKFVIVAAVLLVSAVLFVGIAAAVTPSPEPDPQMDYSDFYDVTYAQSPTDSGYFNYSLDHVTWESTDYGYGLVTIKVNSSYSNILDASDTGNIEGIKVEAKEGYKFKEWRFTSETAGMTNLLINKTEAISSFGLTPNGHYAATITAVFEKEDQKTAGMNVNFTNAKSYVLTVPADFTVTDTETSAGKVNVSQVCLDTGDTLSVSLSSGNFDETDKFRLKHHSEYDYVTYTIKSDSIELETNDVELFSMTNVDDGYPKGKQVTLYFKKTGTPLYSGEYKDTLTFTADITQSSS